MQLARKRGMEPTKPQARALAWLVNDWRESLGSDTDLETAAAERFRPAELDVARQYVRALRARDQCDFSGLLSETVRLLREFPDVRRRLQDSFRFIQVDEYQDTNRAQNEIVELLAGPEDNVLAVGDGDQSIYEWRGASPDGIPQFIENGKAKTGHCKVVKLGVNYRSTPQIVADRGHLIRHCADRIAVEFSTVHQPRRAGEVRGVPKPEDEAEGVAASIQNLVEGGTLPREIAVFYRANDMSRLDRAVPGQAADRLPGGRRRQLLRPHGSEGRAVDAPVPVQPEGRHLLPRIANKPARGMGDALVGKLEAFAERHGVDLLTAMGRADEIRDDAGKPLVRHGDRRACRESLRDLRHRCTCGKTVAADRQRGAGPHPVRRMAEGQVRGEGRVRDPQPERERTGKQHRRLLPATTRGRPSPTTCRASPSTPSRRLARRQRRPPDVPPRLQGPGVRHRLHDRRGARHPPPRKSRARPGRRAGSEEERRLCYVGFTRARKVLRVTWCRQRQDAFARNRTAQYVKSLPSRFLVEAGVMPQEDYAAALQEAGRSAPPSTSAPAAKPPAKKKQKRPSGRPG